jgi:hypothetical protein
MSNAQDQLKEALARIALFPKWTDGEEVRGHHRAETVPPGVLSEYIEAKIGSGLYLSYDGLSRSYNMFDSVGYLGVTFSDLLTVDDMVSNVKNEITYHRIMRHKNLGVIEGGRNV